MLHEEMNFRLLAECEDGYIGVCTCCREFNFAYKNILLSFQAEEMHRFFDWLIASCKSMEHYLPLHHGRNRVLPSPYSNLFLAFNDHEIEVIKALYHQALVLLQAEDLLIVNRRN